MKLKCIPYIKPICRSVCAIARVRWHFEQQGRHVACIKETQTDGCQVGGGKKEKIQFNVAYS